MADTDIITILPPEVLSEIFSYLRPSDQLECRLVCSMWRTAVDTTNLHDVTCVEMSGEDIDMREQDVLEVFADSDSGHKNFRFLDMSVRFGNRFWNGCGASRVASLELVDCVVEEKDLVNILGASVNLRHLTLNNCRESLMSGAVMSSPVDNSTVSQSLCHLQTLILDNNTYLSDVLLLRMVSVSSRIRHLSLSACNIMNHGGIYAKYYPDSQNIDASPSVLTWRTVVRVVEKLAPTLVHLGVSRNSSIDLKQLASVEGLKLESIDISNCSSVTERDFYEFVSGQRNLKKILLGGCRRVFAGLAGTSKMIFECLSNVEEIGLNELSVAHFETVAAMKSLKSLKIDSLDAPGTQIHAGLRGLDLKKLRRLEARFLSLDPNLLRDIFSQKLENIAYLDLSVPGTGVVVDPVVQAVCANLPGLVHLDLAGNPSITDQGTLGMSMAGTLCHKGDFTVDENIHHNMAMPGLVEASESFMRIGPIPLGSTEKSDQILLSKRQRVVEELQQARNEVDSSELSRLSRLTRLQYLGLGGTSITSLTLSVALDCPDLRHLVLSSCDRIDDMGLKDMAVRHPRLERLEAMATPVSDTGLLAALSCLPRLTHLDVRQCQRLTGPGVTPLSQVSPQLTSLKLSHCTGVSKEAANVLVAGLPRLHKLETHGLPTERAGGNPYPLRSAPPTPPPPPGMSWG